MNRDLRRRIGALLISLIMVLIVFTIYVIVTFNNENKNIYTNECRILTATLVSRVEKSYENNNIQGLGDEGYLYTIIDLKGNVLKTTEKIEGNIDVKTDLNFDNWYKAKNSKFIKYSIPVVVDGEVKGILIVTIPKEDILRVNGGDHTLRWIFIGVLGLLIVYIIYKLYSIIRDDILKVINEMHISAKKILKGDYSQRIQYDYNGEIGEFSHDFEAMRDGLKTAKESEERLRKSEKELIACISHDLKTPIATISGYCEGILDGVVKDEENIKRYARTILKKSKVLTKLIDDMLEYSKAEINQMSINKEEVYSKEFFKETIEDISMDVIASGKDFHLEGEIPNVLIKIDKSRINEVINNLISNSIKYTTNMGRISIRIDNLYEYIRVVVEDNGIGIGAEELPYVFNKFYRGEKHRNLDIPGSGLGLSIAKYIVENHGGEISIESQRAEGTQVSFTIKKV